MILSRREFFSIFLMMLALFFIFQFSQVVKTNGNEYNRNDFAKDNKQPKMSDVKTDRPDKTVWIVAAEDGKIADSARQWCIYTKRGYTIFDSLPEPDGSGTVKTIIIDCNTVNIEGKTDELYRLADMGATMIMANLPSSWYIDGDAGLKELLGITEVVENDVHINGIQIFDGFMIGGETVYIAHNENEKKFEDINLDVPWYNTGIGTKTYIVGVMDENQVHPYDFPKLVWRNYYQGTYIYAVNGEYCDGLMGIGFYDAMMYDVSDYFLYPVVNANNVMMSDFPYLSDENSEEINRIYSRTAEGFQKDIAWPGIVAMAKRRDFSLTNFLSTKYDFENNSEYGDDLIFYLQQLKELGAEAGRSLDYKGDITLGDKLDEDSEFYNNSDCSYDFRSIYLPEWDDSLPELLRERNIKMKSIVCGMREGEPVLSFCDEDTTLQYATSRADEYTFKNALLYRSLLTSLGYSNVMIDMKKSFWPESADDEWQNFFDYVYSFITTYWSDDTGFEKTTVSESDDRVRKMLALEYIEEKTENGLSIVTTRVSDAWYVLRTHGEVVTEVRNGTATRLERDIYLIHAYNGSTDISLEESDDIYRYNAR